MNPPNLKEILIAGFLRFAGEGYHHWSKENVSKAIQQGASVNSLDDPEIQSLLRQLEGEGFIKLNFTDSDYLEVLVKN
jgi:hypothetical protein